MLDQFKLFALHLEACARRDGIEWDELVETALISAEHDMDPDPFYEKYMRQAFTGDENYD